MIFLLGTKSKQKINIIKKNLRQVLDSSFNLIPYKVASQVSDQPLDLDTTKQGAKNRAINAIKMHKGNYDFSIGMEAGLSFENGILNMVCVVTIVVLLVVKKPV